VAGDRLAPAVPFVSVVVPVLNGEETIADCLNSLLRTDFPPEQREIVVVDNGSTDGTAQIVDRFAVRRVREGRRGVSHARNRGIAESRGEILAFIDADCTVSTHWLTELVRPLAEGDASAAAGEIVPYPPRTSAERYVARRKPYWQEWVLSAQVPWFLLGNTAIHRGVLGQIGTFDPSLVGCNDIDFSFRFFDAGLRLHYCPTAIVFHRHRATVGALFTQQMRGGRGRALMCRRYGTRLNWGWGDELGAWSDLASGAWRVLKTAGSSLVNREDRSRLRETYVDFVRKLAQRLGFVAGTFLVRLSPAGPSGRRSEA
jgi:glycosyltransferase involved in cell wall biosynthesis